MIKTLTSFIRHNYFVLMREKDLFIIKLLDVHSRALGKIQK